MGKLARALAALCLFAGFVHADTGGHIGGGSWGGGGGGGFSSSSSSHSWSSSSSSSSSSWSFGSSGSSWSSSSSSSGDSGIELVAGILGLVIFGGIGLVKWIMEQSSPSFSSYSSGYSPRQSFNAVNYSAGEVDVSVLRVAIDGRARKFVQTELKRIAGSADMATAEGRAATLREVSLMLRRLKDAWIYGGAINENMTSKSAAKQIFDSHVDDARGRFREETVANVQGKQMPVAQASEYTPHASEGAGVILVSIILAARNELYSVMSIGTGEDLRKALDSAAHRDPADLVAVEIVWQPAEDADRLSSMELEAKYPAPDLIKIKGALAGKMFCAYCSGPFPAELVTCPHCGAPAREPAST